MILASCAREKGGQMNINTNEFIKTLNPNKEVVVFGTGVGIDEETGETKTEQKIIYRGLPESLSSIIVYWTEVTHSYYNEALELTVLRVERDEKAYDEFEDKGNAVVWGTQTVEEFHKCYTFRGGFKYENLSK